MQSWLLSEVWNIKNTQPSYIFIQNSETQNGLRRGLDFIPLVLVTLYLKLIWLWNRGKRLKGVVVDKMLTTVLQYHSVVKVFWKSLAISNSKKWIIFSPLFKMFFGKCQNVGNVRKFLQKIMLSSILPKTNKHFLFISALPSKKWSNKGTLL